MPARKKLIVKLKLAPKTLRSLEPEHKPSASEQASSPEPSSNPIISTAPSPSDALAKSENATPIPNDPSAAATPVGASESTPAPSSLQVPSNPLQKKPGRPGPKPGTKRGSQLMDNGQPKPRGKPGPKKKPRLDDAAATSTPFSTGPAINVPKLGPKANLGAINAGLRALDRTGKPTRRWTKQPFELKSFTGVKYTVNVWRAPRKSIVADIDGSNNENVGVKDEEGVDKTEVDGDTTMVDVSEIA
ncbi:hypothetical protein EJ05DRAFT_542134 [Pseudovirgaria hyperparasitica]|uniref:INO80 complex subunit Ies4 n=1 Tax=Pseudovirgaria hyperparasitica TaxID=470096 RepID=A0A6A6VTQ9_9PEZI|nr:uncharacterized protein EJ05DRAFT_542134 [Pseudovirgaria hyperparasitica]KAF2753114.1 hypothetical protein EJ05DRAFT_542134 [Pseudovirgaria hyperparasitica]